MKLNKIILLGLVLGLTTVSTVWAGDSGGPLAVAPDRQEQKEQKYDADDQRPESNKGSISIPLKFFLHLTDALEDGAFPHESRVTIFQDEDGAVKVEVAPGAEAVEEVYSKGEWLY